MKTNAVQVSLDDLLSGSASFSTIVKVQNPAEPSIDSTLWAGQLRKVYAAMNHGGWMTLREVAFYADCPEASASARIRELTKRGIGHEKRREEGGLYQYRLITPASAKA